MIMTKFIFASLLIFAMPLTAKASLFVTCVTKQDNITAQLKFEGKNVSLQVTKNKTLVHSTKGSASYNDTWNSVVVDGTVQTSKQLKGIKVYFEASRYKNDAAAIRPYGSTIHSLYPGTEGVTVAGMMCNQTFQAIQNEVNNN